MRARAVKKLYRAPEGLRAYGRDRATGSRRLRRGRRHLLRHSPELRDRSSIPLRRQIELLQRDVDRLEAR